LHHARQSAVQRAHVRHRRVAAPLNVLDDPVAVPLAGCKAEQDVKLDGPKGQLIVDRAAGPVHSHGEPLCYAYMHYACTSCQVSAGARPTGVCYTLSSTMHRTEPPSDRRFTPARRGTCRSTLSTPPSIGSRARGF